MTDHEARRADDGTGPSFPGFDCVREHYMVLRDGIDVVVATEQLTNDELTGIANVSEVQAVELRRYVAIRKAMA